jgi:hypothetical protein
LFSEQEKTPQPFFFLVEAGAATARTNQQTNIIATRLSLSEIESIEIAIGDD